MISIRSTVEKIANLKKTGDNKKAGMRLEKAEAIDEEKIIKYLGDIPTQKVHCACLRNRSVIVENIFDDVGDPTSRYIYVGLYILHKP